MKTIGITYTMRNKECKAETYIEIPVHDEAAEHLLDNMKCGYDYMKLVDLMRNLCILQGYNFCEIETIEEV